LDGTNRRAAAVASGARLSTWKEHIHSYGPTLRTLFGKQKSKIQQGKCSKYTLRTPTKNIHLEQVF
jgi:hypothetical protein